MSSPDVLATTLSELLKSCTTSKMSVASVTSCGISITFGSSGMIIANAAPPPT
jgi:hypothetical protein